MKNETIKVNVGGLFSTLLAVAFIVLKLCNVIDWSWWWVLAPLWIPLTLAVLILIIVYILKAILD